MFALVVLIFVTTSEEIMKHQVQSPMFHQVQPGKSHNLSNLLSIARRITMGLTFLAHRLGVIRAQEQLCRAVIQEPGTVLA